MRHFLSLSNLTAAEAGEQDLHSVVPRLFRVRQAGPGTSLLSLATTTTAFSAVRHPWDRLVSAYQVVNSQPFVVLSITMPFLKPAFSPRWWTTGKMRPSTRSCGGS